VRILFFIESKVKGQRLAIQMAVFVISQQILTNIAQINAKAKDNYLREFVKIC
jgi:hypothetical protein